MEFTLTQSSITTTEPIVQHCMMLKLTS